jgi:hypothetical protein
VLTVASKADPVPEAWPAVTSTATDGPFAAPVPLAWFAAPTSAVVALNACPLPAATSALALTELEVLAVASKAWPVPEAMDGPTATDELGPPAVPDPVADPALEARDGLGLWAVPVPDA